MFFAGNTVRFGYPSAEGVATRECAIEKVKTSPDGVVTHVTGVDPSVGGYRCFLVAKMVAPQLVGSVYAY